MTSIVAYGASASSLDNTKAVQAAFDAAGQVPAGGVGEVYVPPGTFKVDGSGGGLRLRSNTRLQIDGALKALPTNVISPVVLRVQDCNNVTIRGPGSVIGERNEHLVGGVARNEASIVIQNSADVTLAGGLVVKDGWSDGVFIHAKPRNITIDAIVCQNNARNGLSIIEAQGLKITNSVFSKTNAPADAQIMPQAGIDIEPNHFEEILLDIWISGNQFLFNRGAGVYIAFEPSGNKTRVYVTNNTFEQHYRDGSGPPIGGRNSKPASLAYACCRWMPSYDWWFYPREFTAS